MPADGSVVPGRAGSAATDGVFNGRPLCEHTAEELLMGSSPTETGGKDPIAVDTDPVYD